jgi:phosphoglycolate/pyridoxal phosphate phosphatase family enzyme
MTTRVLVAAFCSQTRHTTFVTPCSGSTLPQKLVRNSRLFATASKTATELMKEESVAEVEKLDSYYYESASFVPPTIWKSRDEAAKFIDENIDAVLFDCDGVLYRTLDQCPGAGKCVEKLMESGKKVLFVTNNAGVNRRELRDKLAKILGIESLQIEQMVSSSYSCARYLTQHAAKGNRRVHVIGSAGLKEEIENSGFTTTGGPSTESPSMNRQELEDYDFEEHPIDAIAVGHDTEFSFRKLCIANNLLLRNKEALFVATNEDSFDLVGVDNRHIPGNGCVVKALEHCSRRKATNVGKPSATLFELIQEEHNLDPSRSLFVGDRLDTDICFGVRNGMKSLLVLTGVTTAEYMQSLGSGTEEEPLPSFIAAHTGMLV